MLYEVIAFIYSMLYISCWSYSKNGYTLVSAKDSSLLPVRTFNAEKLAAAGKVRDTERERGRER